jgi:hypothetical protein
MQFHCKELSTIAAKGVGGCGSRTKGWREGVRPKAEKKFVTSPILMAEVVPDVPFDVPKATSNGSARVRIELP